MSPDSKAAQYTALAVALALLSASAILVGAKSAAAAAGRASSEKRFTLYAVATSAQFVDHSDDRARGNTINPFDADTAKLAPASKAKEKGSGPYPGDDALYSFKLYGSSTLKSSIGVATLTCVYNFSKQALCEANITLKTGTLFGSGPVDFTGTDFTLAVTGGTGRYLGSRGEFASTPQPKPVKKNEQHFSFTLV